MIYYLFYFFISLFALSLPFFVKQNIIYIIIIITIFFPIPIMSGFGTNLLSTILIIFFSISTLIRNKWKFPFILFWGIFLMILTFQLLGTSEYYFINAIKWYAIIFSCFIFFYFTYNLITKENYIKYLKLIVIFSVLEAFVSYLQVIVPNIMKKVQIFNLSNTMTKIGELRVRGTFGSYELLAEFFCIILILLIILFQKRDLSLYKFLTCFIIIFSALVLTATRGAFILFVFSSIILLFTRAIIFRHKKTYIFSIIAILIFGFIIIQFSNSLPQIPKIIDRLIFERTTDFIYYKGLLIPSNRVIWYEYYDIISGSNLNNKLIGISLTKPGFIENISQPHSLYLHLIYITGFIGIIAFFVPIFIIIKKLIINIINVFDRNQKYIFFGLLFILLIILIDQYKVSMFREAGYPQFIFSFLGIIYAIIDKKLLVNNEASRNC